MLSQTPESMTVAFTIQVDTCCIGLTWIEFRIVYCCTAVYVVSLQNIWPNYVFLSLEDHSTVCQ